MSVSVTFRGGIAVQVSDQDATGISDAFARYNETRSDELIAVHGRQLRISHLEAMETVREQPLAPLPIEEAMRQSAAEEQDETKRKLKDAQIKIFRHNQHCLANRKMDDFIWYFVENNKIFRSTKEDLGKRFVTRSRV